VACEADLLEQIIIEQGIYRKHEHVGDGGHCLTYK
jgi:hypothetical protein